MQRALGERKYTKSVYSKRSTKLSSQVKTHYRSGPLCLTRNQLTQPLQYSPSRRAALAPSNLHLFFGRKYTVLSNHTLLVAEAGERDQGWYHCRARVRADETLTQEYSAQLTLACECWAREGTPVSVGDGRELSCL